ncbi:GntR family transcriptional regulator [Rathayibacter sp. VKM Ac-2835]|uniref:GntR family transcriptional regulator n=1 Tax=Rathayibacter sp. VKM Ac-2835 TaxID=2739043 RepID=UPI00349F8F40
MPEEIGLRCDVSRTAVREAFRALEARGMIRARPRAGTQVQPEKAPTARCGSGRRRR